MGNERGAFPSRLTLTRGTPCRLTTHTGHALALGLAGSVSVSDIIGGASIGSVCLRALEGKFGGCFEGRGLVSWLV